MQAITAAALGTGIGLVDSLIRSQKASKLMKKLERQGMPQYRSAQDIQREAQATAKGFSPEEMAKARGDIARQSAAGYRMATQTNPNLAGAVQAGINYGTIGQYGELAARDAMMRRQRASELAQLLTSADVRKTSEDRQIQLRAIEGAGLAKQQAGQQAIGLLQNFTYAMGSMGNTNKTTTTTTPTTGGLGPNGIPLASAVGEAPNYNEIGSSLLTLGKYPK